MKSKKKIIGGAIAAGAAMATAGAALTHWTYKLAFRSPDKTQNNIRNIPTQEQYQEKREEMLAMVERLAAIPYEAVTITSRDGLRLAGKYYHVADGAPLDIGFHGYRGTAIRDFCGGAIIGIESGHNILLVDQRAHGESEGNTITFGIEERYDCLDWINYAIQRFGEDTKILLYGVSMGGATVLMASGLPLPPNVKGIIADCPYSSPKDIIQKVAGELGYPPRLSYPFITAGARLYGHFDLNCMTAAEAVKTATVPIMIIHGEDDRFVPAEMSEQIYLANPECIRRHTFPGAGHGLSYIVDYDRYKALVAEFLKEVG